MFWISYRKYIRDFLWEIKRTSKSYIRYTGQKRKFLSTIHFQIWLKILNIFRAIKRTSKSYIRYTEQKFNFIIQKIDNFGLKTKGNYQKIDNFGSKVKEIMQKVYQTKFVTPQLTLTLQTLIS